ncbi:DNA-directed RNA polymerase subunit RPC12/RpoP [Peptoniphilus gorbachii]|uniref:DNA-directed RNA polymerase subunit RPC12/RpoP n=2 Tax=Peptoniphilus gorbachii TaxID=411567 RepID=A0ABS2MJP5_9FIRM|nr:DNA-directed RNA polymerase subunit RPC12/RpoP [Peptoniphilus gorbachii]
MRKFMIGRYGQDELGKFILSLALILLIINLFVKTAALSAAALVLIIYSYYRIFSRDVRARYAENKKFLTSLDPLRRKFFSSKNKYDNRKLYKYIKCPKCKFEMKAPKNKGKIRVTCKKCGEKFIVKS